MKTKIRTTLKALKARQLELVELASMGQITSAQVKEFEANGAQVNSLAKKLA